MLNGGTFYHMLPALMNRNRGGSIITQAIGLLLRRSGADALVYPSARTNVRVIVEDGKPINWNGWNLVDYRGAPNPKTPDESGCIMLSMRSGGEEAAEGLLEERDLKSRTASNKERIAYYTLDLVWSPPGTPRELSFRASTKGINAESFEVYNHVERGLHLPPTEEEAG